MLNPKNFLTLTTGYQLVNTFQQSTAISFSKCSISNNSNQNDKNSFKLIENNTNVMKLELENAKISNTYITDFLKTKSIKYCQGWNNLNIYSCPKAQDSFYINRNGFNFFEYVYIIDLF